MRTWLLILTVVLSALCAALLGIWVRSYWYRSGIWFGGDQIHLHCGNLFLARYSGPKCHDPDTTHHLSYDSFDDECEPSVATNSPIENLLLLSDMRPTKRHDPYDALRDPGLGGLRHGFWMIGYEEPKCGFACLPLWMPTFALGIGAALTLRQLRRLPKEREPAPTTTGDA